MTAKLGLALLAIGCVAAHAGTVVTPNGDAAANGNAVSYIPFGEGTIAAEFQWEIASSQLTSLVNNNITAIGFRLSGGEASQFGPISIGTFSLELSGAANPIGSLSTTFANNISPGGVTVYSGSLSLGSLTGGTGPNPFFLINFTTPFLYTGGNLLITENVQNSSGFTVDANSPDANGDTAGLVTGFPATTHVYNYPTTELIGTLTTVGTPEPASLFTFAAGLALLGGLRRYQSRRSMK